MSDLDLLVSRAASAGVVRVFKEGEVPASPVMPYMVLGLDTGTPTSLRADGRSPNTRHRLTARFISKTDDALRDMADLADEAFKDVCLSEFDDEPYCYRELGVSPIAPNRDPDAGGVLYALHTYRF